MRKDSRLKGLSLTRSSEDEEADELGRRSVLIECRQQSQRDAPERVAEDDGNLVVPRPGELLSADEDEEGGEEEEGENEDSTPNRRGASNDLEVLRDCRRGNE